MGEFDKDFLIRIISDASKAKTDIDATKRALLTLDDTAARVGSKLGDIKRVAQIDALGNEMGELAKKTGDVDSAVVKLTESLHKMGASTSEIDRATSAFQSAQDAADVVSGGGGGGGTSKLTQFGSKLRSLPSMQIPGTNTGTDALANVIRLLGAIPPVALPAIAALTAVGGAFVIMTKSLEDGKKALDDAIAAENEYFKAVSDLTTAQARQQIADLQRRNDAIKEQVDKETKVAVDGAKQAANAFSPLTEVARLIGGNTAALGAQMLEAKATTGQLTDNIDKLNTEYGKNQVEIDKLTQGLNDNAFAANDTAEAEKALADLRDRLADEFIAHEVQVAKLRRDGTKEQVDDIIQAAKDENAAIQEVLDRVKAGTETLSPDKIKAYNEELEKNNITIDDLTESVRQYTVVNDKTKQLLKDQEKAQDDLAKVQESAANDEKKRAADIDAINTKTAAAYDKLAESYKRAGEVADLAAKQADEKTARTRADEDAKAERDRNRKLIELDKERDDKIIEAERKRDELIKKAKDQFAFDEANAIQDRNAVALDAAQRKRDKDIQDAKDGYDQEKAAAEENRKERIKELEQQFKDEAEERKIARENQDRETAIQRRQDTEKRRQKYLQDQDDLAAAQRAEILARQNAYLKQIADLNAYLTEQEKNNEGYFGTILAAATKFQSDLQNILNGGSPSGNGTPASANHTVPTNSVPLPGQRLPAPNDLQAFTYGGTTGKGATGGTTINIPVYGQGKEAVKQQINAHIDQVWTGMGW